MVIIAENCDQSIQKKRVKFLSKWFMLGYVLHVLDLLFEMIFKFFQ